RTKNLPVVPPVALVPEVTLQTSCHEKGQIIKVLDTYYDFDESTEPLKDAVLGSEKGEIDLELFLEKLAAKCNTLLQKWAQAKKKNLLKNL
ncbi:26191_t:CDS:1, partial [Dentiscutata erythropus]